MQNSIPSLLRIWSDLSPQAPALLGLGRPPLSYQRLLGQVEQVVQTLNEFGIGRSDKVAIVLENGPEMASCFLSVASGATSAPLNPGCTEAEFRLYLSDLRPKAIVVAAESASPAISVANAMGISVLRLFSCPGEPAGVFRLEGTAVACSLDRAQQGFAQPSDVALMLHTSGSTAQPRAVPLTHANLCHSARSIGASLDLGANDRCLNVVSLFHVHGLISALLASLAAGASVVCTPGFDAVSFFDWLD